MALKIDKSMKKDSVMVFRYQL